MAESDVSGVAVPGREEAPGTDRTRPSDFRRIPAGPSPTQADSALAAAFMAFLYSRTLSRLCWSTMSATER